MDPLLQERCYMMVGYDPLFYKKAFHDTRQQVSMDEEYDSLQNNETCNIVSLPSGGNIVWCNWIYKTKITSDGPTTKYKAQLVTKGYFHVYGLEYDDTFTHVSRMDYISIFLSIVASKQWEVHHMDVKSSFLQGELEEDIYMKHPEGYTTDPSLVCKIRKSLYRLKQAPRVSCTPISITFYV